MFRTTRCSASSMLFGKPSRLEYAALTEQSDGTTVTIGGLVGSITRRFTRKGDPMLFFQVEDLEGSIEVVAFPKVVMETGPMIREDAIVIITGRVDNRGDEVKIIAQQVREPELGSETTVRLEVPATLLSPNMVERLKEILVNHPGTAPVYLHMTSESGHKVWKLSDEHRVEPAFRSVRRTAGAPRARKRSFESRVLRSPVNDRCSGASS